MNTEGNWDYRHTRNSTRHKDGSEIRYKSNNINRLRRGADTAKIVQRSGSGLPAAPVAECLGRIATLPAEWVGRATTKPPSHLGGLTCDRLQTLFAVVARLRILSLGYAYENHSPAGCLRGGRPAGNRASILHQVAGRRFVYSGAQQYQSAADSRVVTRCSATNRFWEVWTTHNPSFADSGQVPYVTGVYLNLGLVLREYTNPEQDWVLSDGPDGEARGSNWHVPYDSANRRNIDYRFEVSYVVQGRKVEEVWHTGVTEYGYIENSQIVSHTRHATEVAMSGLLTDRVSPVFGPAGHSFTLGFYAKSLQHDRDVESDNEPRQLIRSMKLELETDGLDRAIRETKRCAEAKAIANAPPLLHECAVYTTEVLPRCASRQP